MVARRLAERSSLVAPLAALAALVTACGQAEGPRPAASAAPIAPASGAPTFSREAFAPSGADAGAAEFTVPSSPDPAVLDEIVAAADKAKITAPPVDAGAIGSDTGVASDAGAPPPASAASDAGAPSARISVGKPALVPDMSDPAIERTARAQLYWPLVQRCRGPGGGLLPPEAVHLKFQLDPDGYVVPASVIAIPKEARFADAARCMGREVASSSFRAPPSARSRTHTIDSDVPSVD